MGTEQRIKMVIDTLTGYLSFAKNNPGCAEKMSLMAEGFALGARMMALCNNEPGAYQKIEILWNNELEPAFKALLTTQE